MDKSNSDASVSSEHPAKDRPDIASYPCGWRHAVTALAFLGFVCMYSMRINMGVALVAMVDHRQVARRYGGQMNQTSICIPPETVNVTASATASGTYMWDGQLQGVILSAFFYGYILTQLAGGLMSAKYGSKWVFGLGNAMTAVFTLLSPKAADWGVGAFIFVRVMQGFSSGVTWPSMQSFFARWAPPSERSFLPAMAYAGSFVGTPITFLLSGLLIDSGFMGGWPSVFYVFGFACLVWFALWAVLSSCGPETHRFISEGERSYIVKAIQGSAGTQVPKPGMCDVPWRRVLKSLAVWAVIVSHFTYNYGLYTLMTTLPTYFKRVQGFDIKKNGALSALPYLVQCVVHVASGKLADLLRSRYGVGTTTVRKGFDCLGHLLPAIFVVWLAFVGCRGYVAVAVLTSAIAATGLCGAGWFVNFLDLAPNHASVLFGVSNTFSTVPGIVGPYLTGVLTRGNTVGSWRVAFFVIGFLYAFSAIFFFFMGSGEVEDWSVVAPEGGADKSASASGSGQSSEQNSAA